MEEQAIIYGVKTDESFKYIGKTIKSIKANRELKTSDVGVKYTNKGVKTVLNDNDVNMVVLKTIATQNWYDEKLQEVVDKHKDNHPLLNAQWMLEGKRGYWEGKERDKHTLQRLSESKYKKIVQYDLEGKQIKVWNSGKEVAIKIFKDYHVTNGCGCTRLYSILKTSILKNRLKHGSYWFKEQELILNFGVIPKKINLDTIREKEILKRKEIRRKQGINQTTRRRYTVIYCDINGNEIDRFPNIFEAGFALKLNPNLVGKICRGVRIPKNYILKYGEKELQPIDIPKPQYKTKPINARRKIKKEYQNFDFDLTDVEL